MIPLQLLRRFILNIKFELIKFYRRLFILFKINKNLEKISFDYYKYWHFDKSFLFVDFKFKNAVWYRIGNYKNYVFKKQLVLDLEFIKSSKVIFEVYGFFQKQVFEINLNRENKFDSDAFNFKVFNVSELKVSNNIIYLNPTSIKILPYYLKCNIDNIFHTNRNIKIQFKQFKIQEYL